MKKLLVNGDRFCSEGGHSYGIRHLISQVSGLAGRLRAVRLSQIRQRCNSVCVCSIVKMIAQKKSQDGLSV